MAAGGAAKLAAMEAAWLAKEADAREAAVNEAAAGEEADRVEVTKGVTVGMAVATEAAIRVAARAVAVAAAVARKAAAATGATVWTEAAMASGTADACTRDAGHTYTQSPHKMRRRA